MRSTHRALTLRLAFAILTCVSITDVTATLANDFGIFDWVREAPGGIYHPHQSFQTQDGVSGIFATEFIPKGTVLVSVPWSHVIPSDDPEERGQLCCGLVTRLKRELAKGDHSQFAPYIQYLRETQWNVSLPTSWSRKGQALLLDIVGRESNGAVTLPPEEPIKWLKGEWVPDCRGSMKDKLGVKAALIVITRSDDHILIPGYDMYNHRNGKWLNTETKSIEGVKHITVATRDIHPGEQIYITYNLCRGCVGRRHFYGTGEILRDYGFVERMPQRFYYDTNFGLVQFDIDETPDGMTLTWDNELSPDKDKYGKTMMLKFFRREIRRLRRLRNIDYRNGNPGMPAREWETCWEFQQANIRAMSLAMKSIEASMTTDVPVNVTMTTEAPLLVESHYDLLGPEIDDLPYAEETCDNDDLLDHEDHTIVDFEQTRYQEIRFRIEPRTKDVVMELDDITQIASVYRPQYHEYSVHAAARFLSSVNRVIFIGGGDSMLLHEILKYPELELVVGLELDQTVTRKSFKYFSTQPHFDDPRVEWWFGDATKTLLLLPKEYWQSFDLVLVDLSETVMSFSVTDQLDVFDALALLLKPHGILVKNEVYMEAISQVFDHTIQICYESPIICDQVLAMGSNGVDFLHAPLKDHNIETLLYTPLVTNENRYEYLHDYRRNDAHSQGKCNLTKPELRQPSRSAGILDIIEAEETLVPLDESLVGMFESAVQQEGFHVVRDSLYTEDQIMIFMKEGYILARLVPDKNYCSFDVHLWGRFSQLKSLRKSLIQTLKSQLVSNYRVVVGGMYGSSTWAEDQATIGPQIVQNRDCSEPSLDDGNTAVDVDQPTLVTAALEESMKILFQGTGSHAVVLCGQMDQCLVHEVLSKTTRFTKVVRLSTCPQLDPEMPNSLYDCEISFSANWQKVLSSQTSDVFAIDATVPLEMVQIVNSLLYDDDFRSSVIAETNLVFTVGTESWRRHFLDRYRKQHYIDPVSHATYRLQAGAVSIDFGVVSAGDKAAIYHFEQLEASLKNRLTSAKIDLLDIHGGKYAYWDPWDPKKFLQSDYDDSAGLSQYFAQMPMAQHSIIQFKPIGDSDFEFEKKNIETVFMHSLKAVGFVCPTNLLVDDVGDGYMLVCLNGDSGSAILTWDGRQHIDVSFFLSDVDATEIDRFVLAFRSKVRLQLDSALRDDMPRGMGRVINFPEDIMTPKERDDFFESLSKPEIDRMEEQYYRRVLGTPIKVEQGSCSNPDADQSTCWPDPPPL